MKIDCLLDANSIIKYYFPLPGSNIIKYLLEKSPSARVNITTVQIVEVISLFYKFRREGVITSDEQREQFKDTFFNDIKIGKITGYDFVEEHFLDFEVYDKITVTPPPSKRWLPVYVKEFGGFVKELKDIADSADAIMLMIMREMHLITDGRCYLFTSDGHVKKVAEAMKLNVVDPEKIVLDDLPLPLDKRIIKRRRCNLRVVCKEAELLNTIGSTNITDICSNGACINFGKKLDAGKQLVLKISEHNDNGFPVEQKAEVAWSDGQRFGVRFNEPITSSRFFS